MESKRVSFILVCITLLGAWLRLYHINFQSLWIEELYPIRVNDPVNHVLTIIEFSRSDGSQAFNMLLYYCFKIFSYNESVARIICAVMGILAIPSSFFLVKEVSGAKAGLFASLLVAINYWHITYSQELNIYSMAFLFSTLSYLFFIRAYKFTREKDFAGYVICTIILLNTHSYGFIILVSQVITGALLIKYFTPEKKYIEGIAIGLSAILIFAPWSSALSNNLFKGYSWMPHPKAYFILPYFHNYFGKDVFITLIFAFLSGLFILSLVRDFRIAPPKVNPLYIFLILWLLLSYLIPFTKSLFGNSILDLRSTIVSLPAWIALIAMGWSKLENEKLKIGVIVLILLSSFINLFYVKGYYSTIRKDQIREASQFLMTKNIKNYPVYSGNSWQFNFYFRDAPSEVIPVDSLISDKNNVSTFWLLDVGNPMEKVTKLTPEFKILEQHSFYNANAILLEKKEE